MKKRMARREFAAEAATGFNAMALAMMLREEAVGGGAVEVLHHPPRAKRVVQLFMGGAASHIDLWDHKPMLDKHHGKEYFEKIAGEVEFPQAAGALMRSPFAFKQHGESGTWVSEVMPHLAQQVDDIALIRSMYSSN